MENHYQSEEEIEAVVSGFESCTIAKDAFTHREHLTAAVWYLRTSTPEQALDRMRSSLFRFIEHHDVDRTKYKEAVTVAWIKLVQETLDQLPPQLSLVEVTNVVIERLGDSSLIPKSTGEVGDIT